MCDDAWAFWEFLPTAVELAGAKLPEGFEPDGLSLTAMLKGGPGPERDCFYWELHEGPFLEAVRFGDWKAVRNGPAKESRATQRLERKARALSISAGISPTTPDA